MTDESTATTPLRVATWNMNHWQTPVKQRTAAWKWLRESSGLDVALLQETVPPFADPGRLVYREIAGRRPWGSAVVSLNDEIGVEEIWSVGSGQYRHRPNATYPGSVAVARIRVPGIAPITAVSIYNLLDGHPSANLLRVIADLVPLLDSVDGDRVIVGGDLNVYGATAELKKTKTKALFDLMAGLGLKPIASHAGIERPPSPEACPCSRPDCGHIPTWRDFDLDHYFVSSRLLDQVTRLDVERTVVNPLAFSDHAALVLHLELSAAPVKRPWDPESFVAEVRARHGETAAGVVEQLLQWAAIREDAMRRSGTTDRTLVDHDLPRAIDPTLFVRLRFFDRSLTPQWLVSVNAEQAVLHVSFRYLNHPPFDVPENREPLRRILNEIRGVEIPASRLGGRPAIPLAVLAEEGAMPRLLEMLDRVVTETIPRTQAVE